MSNRIAPPPRPSAHTSVGLGVAEQPAPDTPVGDTIGYHLRTGAHNILAYDWEQYLNFADRQWKASP